MPMRPCPHFNQSVYIQIRLLKAYFHLTSDLLFTNSPSPVNRVKGMPPIGKADHDIIHVEYDIKAKRIKQAPRKIYLYKRADMEGLRDHLTCSAKYLGLTITDDLEWGQHISEISCKATKTLGFLRRNLALAPRHTKEVAYKTLVPQLEYAAPIWHPYNETETKKVEKVQKTAARWTCRRWRNRSSDDDMLDELVWPSLEDRRVKSSLTFFYKYHSGTVSLDKDIYLTPAPNLRSTRASQTHNSQYTRYMAHSDALKNSFFPRTIPLWNSLPSSVVSSKTAEEFKALI